MPPFSLIVSELSEVVLPAFIGAAAMFALFSFLSRTFAEGWGAVIAVIVGGFAGHGFRDLLPLWPERLGWTCLGLCVFKALIVGRAAPSLTVASVLLRFAVAGNFSWLLVPEGYWKSSDDPFSSAGWLPGFAVLVAVEWMILETAARKHPGGIVPFVAALALGSGAGVLIHAGSARMMDIAVVGFATFAGLALIASLRRLNVSAAMPAVAVVLPGLLLGGQYETYSEVRWTSFAWVAAAPLGMFPAIVWSDRRGLWLGAFLVLIIASVGVFTAMQAAGPLEFGE